MARSNLRPSALYGENIKNSVSQNALKTFGCNLQCMTKAANPFSYNQKFVPWGYLPLSADHNTLRAT